MTEHQPMVAQCLFEIRRGLRRGFGVYNSSGEFLCGGTLVECQDFIKRETDDIFDPSKSDSITIPREDFLKHLDDTKELARLKRHMDPTTMKIAERFRHEDEELVHAPDVKPGVWDKVAKLRGRS